MPRAFLPYYEAVSSEDIHFLHYYLVYLGLYVFRLET